MLLRNYSSIHQVLGRQFGGLTSPVTYKKPEVMRNYFSQPGSGDIERVKRDSFPTGTNPPYSLVMGPKGGLLSATTTISGTGNISSNLTQGKALSATLSGTSTLSANASLIVQLAAALAGTSELTASAKGVINMAANLAGSGNIAAGLSMLVGLAASLNGTGGLSANLRGTASMSADIQVNSGAATTNELVAAIWGAIAANYNEAGTMGAKMNSAASAGDPWGTALPGSYADGEAGKILSQIQVLMEELHKLKGLNASAPVTITPTSITATGIDIAIGGDGETSSELQRL